MRGKGRPGTVMTGPVADLACPMACKLGMSCLKQGASIGRQPFPAPREDILPAFTANMPHPRSPLDTASCATEMPSG